jgi:hypothetical protein
MVVTIPTLAMVTTLPNNAHNQTKTCLHQLIQFRQPIKTVIHHASVEESDLIRHAAPTRARLSALWLPPPSRPISPRRTNHTLSDQNATS